MFFIKFSFYFILKYLSYFLPSYKKKEKRQELQVRKLKRIVKYAKMHSPFYNKHLSFVDDNNLCLQDFPVVNKNILVNNLEDVLTEKLVKSDIERYLDTEFAFDKKYKKKYLIFHTSGSSGSSVNVVWGAREFATATAMLMVKNIGLLTTTNPFKILFRRKKYLYIGIIDDYIGGNSWVYAMRYLANIKIISIFTPIDKMVEEIEKFAPEFIMAKPHVLGEIAEKLVEKSIKLNIQKIIFVGEMLTDRDKEMIRKGFGKLAFNSYSTCETGPIAYEKKPETLTIMDEEVILELLDEDNRSITEYYKLGHIVITNLYNKIMPIIRYDIGDMAYFIPNNNDDKLNTICYIKGRNTSYFDFRDKSNNLIKISEYPFWSIHVHGIAHYQIIQLDNSKVKILLEFEKGEKNVEDLKAKFEDKMKRIFPEQFFNAQLEVVYEYVEKIPVTKSGKIVITQPMKR